METVIFLIVIFVANTIQAITGFAGTVLAMPPSILLIGLDDAKVILSVMAFLSCLVISVQNKQYINTKEVAKICGFMLVGMLVGVTIGKYVPSDILLNAYAVVVVLIGVKNLVFKKNIELSQAPLIVILLLAGIIHWLFLSGGALLVIYAVCVLKDKNTFRATIAPVWVILNGLLIAVYFSNGLIHSESMKLIAMSIIPLIIATKLGNILQSKINQESFLKLTYVLLIISGLSIF